MIPTMTTVNIHEAKTHFSRLVERAAKGESIVIAKAGKPLARLVPLERAPITAEQAQRRIGFMKGKFEVPDDFDTMFAQEIEDMFNGKP
jgi:prevent-host-death family protein